MNGQITNDEYYRLYQLCMVQSAKTKKVMEQASNELDSTDAKMQEAANAVLKTQEALTLQTGLVVQSVNNAGKNHEHLYVTAGLGLLAGALFGKYVWK